MVEVEITVPIHNEETERVESVRVALVRADGAEIEIIGDASAVPPAPVVSITTGESVEPAENLEEWARNLPYAYRSGNPRATVLHDDNPPQVNDSDDELVEPSIPDPPEPVHEEAADGHAVSV